MCRPGFRTISATLLLALAAGTLGVGVATAQGPGAPVPPRGPTPAREALTPTRSEETLTMPMAEVVDGGNQFAIEFYLALRNQPGNLFFSPGSISMALAMTYAGAAGTTQQEMAETLHFPTSQSQLHEAMRAQLEQWTTPADNQGYRLHVANRLWGQERFQFQAPFLAVTRTQYGAELARLDFGRDTEAARGTINQWVAAQTQDKITDLIPTGVLSRDTMLVLTNAVYFKGDWTRAFDQQRTRDEDFYLAADKTVVAPLMHQRGKFRYAAVDGLKVLEMPYGNADLAMVILLPDQVEGLADLETRLSREHLQLWIAKLAAQEVQVSVPKFTITATYQLNDTLQQLGLHSAFDPATADFSGMTGSRDLYISQVLHKAFVDVYEEGTEAAAATGVVIGRTSVTIPKPIPEFRADHPFVFLIRDNRSGAILFLGRVTNPAA